MAFDCFLEIEGIRGECSDEAHRTAIEVMGYAHGIAHTGGMTGGGAGSPVADHKDFVVQKTVDQTTPILAQACSRGTRYPTAKIQVARATKEKETYWEIEMRNVFIRSIQFAASSDGDLPTESIALGYTEIVWTYYLFDHKTGRPLGQNRAMVSLETGG